MSLYFTTLLGAPITTSKFDVVGELDDLLADARQWPVPRVLRVEARFHDRDRGWLHAESVRRFDPVGVVIQAGASWNPPDRTHLLRLRGQLLDHQIIDLVAGSVVRVNDIVLEARPEGYVVTGIDVGLAGLARELAPRPNRSLFARVQPRSPWTRELGWVDIEPVESSISHFQLFDAQAGLGRLTPAAIARVLRALRPSDRMAILGALSGESVAAVLEAADANLRRLLMAQLNH